MLLGCPMNTELSMKKEVSVSTGRGAKTSQTIRTWFPGKIYNRLFSLPNTSADAEDLKAIWIYHMLISH